MMALDIYWIGLIVLVPTVAFAAGHNIILKPFRRTGRIRAESQERFPLNKKRDEEARKFRWTFLQVYLLVMGSEWLQVSDTSHLFPSFIHQQTDVRIERDPTCTPSSATKKAYPNPL